MYVNHLAVCLFQVFIVHDSVCAGCFILKTDRCTTLFRCPTSCLVVRGTVGQVIQWRNMSTDDIIIIQDR